MNKAIKYKLYPTSKQKELFAKTFGCCRKIWNLMLADKIEYYKTTGKMLMTTPAKYKKLDEYKYLKEVDSLALANVQLHLQTAYKNFFRDNKIGFPKFKSAKHNRKTYTTNNQKGTISLSNNSIRLPKIGVVKAKIYRKPELDWKIKSATITQDNDGKFYVSVLFEFDKSITKLPVSNNAIGFDYKSDGLYTDSFGNTCGNPKYYRKSQRKLARLQRQISRKTKDSNNRNKARMKVARLQKHTANQRLDFLHKKSTEIANQYDIVCVESLDMKNMSNKGFGNGKATLDNGYGMFLSMLDYKLADRGKHFVKVDKWYPSSQICYLCGKQHKKMKDLSVRQFVCDCGYSNDRDINAALNIKREGLRLLQTA
jgi:putative transposase